MIPLLLLILAQGPPQVVHPTSIISWWQQAPKLESAQGYLYKAYIGGQPYTMTLKACTINTKLGGFDCTAGWPNYSSPGATDFQMTATNEVGESDKSTPSIRIRFSK